MNLKRSHLGTLRSVYLIIARVARMWRNVTGYYEILFVELLELLIADTGNFKTMTSVTSTHVAKRAS
jgi:hypothetical protein